MISAFYEALAAIGYTHPLHPVIVHIPMGMVVGGFIFALASTKWENLLRTSYYCVVLALIFTPFTVLFGIMDWMYRYNGVWSHLFILKYVLAGTLIVLLSVFGYLNRNKTMNYKVYMVFYALCLINAIILGLIGGEILYG